MAGAHPATSEMRKSVADGRSGTAENRDRLSPGRVGTSENRKLKMGNPARFARSYYGDGTPLSWFPAVIQGQVGLFAVAPFAVHHVSARTGRSRPASGSQAGRPHPRGLPGSNHTDESQSAYALEGLDEQDAAHSIAAHAYRSQCPEQPLRALACWNRMARLEI